MLCFLYTVGLFIALALLTQFERLDILILLHFVIQEPGSSLWLWHVETSQPGVILSYRNHILCISLTGAHSGLVESAAYAALEALFKKKNTKLQIQPWEEHIHASGGVPGCPSVPAS